MAQEDSSFSPSRRPGSVSGTVARIADTVVGGRIKASIDRRIRAEMRRHAARQEQFLAAALDGPELKARIVGEVGRQVSACQLAAEEARSNDPSRKAREFTADLLFGTGGRHDRTLDPQRYATLADQIRELSGVNNVQWPMQQAFRSLLDHEVRGLGRIAGSSYNIIGKLVLPPLLSVPPGPVLEIGTLFGLFSPALIRQFRRAGEFRGLTVVDPFVGLQIQPGTSNSGDPTGTPVTAEVASRNFALGDLRPEEVRIVKGFSTEEDVQDAVGDRDYAVVIVDGDHSEEGVYRDLWWVEKLVIAGGLVVMDDFGDERWQGVERAGRRYLADGGRLRLIGQASTSAYLRMPD